MSGATRESIAAAFYPSMAQPAAAPDATPPAAAAPAPQPMSQVKPAEHELGLREQAAEAMYPLSGVALRGHVDWNEGPAQAADYILDAREVRTMRDGTPEGQAAEQRFRNALAEAGVGKTLAEELWRDAVHAERRTFTPMSAEQSHAELRRMWGDRYDAKLALARGAFQQVAQRSPEVVAFAERTGLANDPKFIVKLAAWAARRKK